MLKLRHNVIIQKSSKIHKEHTRVHSRASVFRSSENGQMRLSIRVTIAGREWEEILQNTCVTEDWYAAYHRTPTTQQAEDKQAKDPNRNRSMGDTYVAVKCQDNTQCLGRVLQGDHRRPD